MKRWGWRKLMTSKMLVIRTILFYQTFFLSWYLIPEKLQFPAKFISSTSRRHQLWQIFSDDTILKTYTHKKERTKNLLALCSFPVCCHDPTSESQLERTKTFLQQSKEKTNDFHFLFLFIHHFSFYFQISYFHKSF